MRRIGVRTRIAVVIAALAVVATLLVLVLGGSHAARRRPTAGGASPARTATAPAPPSPGVTNVPQQPAGDGSPDSYAAYLAEGLWNIDYSRTSRKQDEQFWRAQLADTVPAGAPTGTTVTQAQQAALSALDQRLPAAATWATLAATGTRSSFVITSVSEPSSWISAVADGQIVDPGLTARTVLGVQTLTYGTPAHTTRQTQSVTVVMLCPPTTPTCRLEIIPPDDTATGP